MGTDATHEAMNTELQAVEVLDERTPLADAVLALIERSFPPHERHSTEALRAEIAESRLGLLTSYHYHLLALVDDRGEPRATIAGRYLAGLNAGFITYLAVDPSMRGRWLGREVRSGLVDVFREDARRAGHEDLAWMLGEVQIGSRWLSALVRHGRAIPFDLTYYHPGMLPGASAERYVLYRQPILDERPVLSAGEVRRVLYSVWRRGYRVTYPLSHPAFRAMLEELEGREMVGAHAEVGGE